MSIASDLKKKVKKALKIGPGRPPKGQKMKKTGTYKNGKDKHKKTII